MFRETRMASVDYLNEMIQQVLDEISGYIELSKKQSSEIRIICEEILVNIIHYAYQEPGDMTVDLEFCKEAGSVIMWFLDNGVAFNPLENQEPDLTADVMDRPIGGLGIFMVKNIAESVQYERLGNQNRLKVMLGYKEWKNTDIDKKVNQG